MAVLLGVFLILHGLAHLLYLGHGLQLFDLRPGLAWPADAWAFAWLADGHVRAAAAIACILATAGFLVSGVALLTGQIWWREATVVAAVVSALTWLLFWDATPQDLPDQGGVAVLIDAALLFVVLVFPRPDLVS